MAPATWSTSFLEASYEGSIQIKNRDLLRSSDSVLVAIGRNVTVTILDERGVERSSQHVAYGSKLHADEGGS